MNVYARSSCCFATGHRYMPSRLRSQILVRIREICERLIKQGIVHYYAGGAKGFDMWFSCVILELKQTHPAVTLTVLLPSKDYTDTFTPEEKILQRYILSRADEVETIPALFGEIPALKRDDALIAAGDTCVCYLRGNRLTVRGGTSYTVRHALEKNRRIYSVWRTEDEDYYQTC